MMVDFLNLPNHFARLLWTARYVRAVRHLFAQQVLTDGKASGSNDLLELQPVSDQVVGANRTASNIVVQG